MITINNAMTIDVEDYFHVSAFAKVIKRERWGEMECRVERNTHRFLEIFAEHNIFSTFFVLGWVTERYPSLVREIAAAGHEIACHGYSHQLVYQQNEQVFKQETLKAKALLEDCVQTEVLGYRAASYSITNASLWALDILVDAGFRYDSSIFPIRHDRYGIPDAQKAPHMLTAPNGGRLVEFPISTAQLLRQNVPVAGGGYFRLLPYFVTRAGLRSINSREKLPFIFYLHPWEIDTGQPRIEASWLSKFRHYNNLEKCEPRLSRLLSDFKFTTVKNVLTELRLLDTQLVIHKKAAKAASN